ncbi:unnamed protein product [Camellia sinensis]
MESGLDPQMSNTSHGSEDESLMEMGSGSFGCSHYRRRCKIRAPCCDEIFDCRHCHNESKDVIQRIPNFLMALNTFNSFKKIKDAIESHNTARCSIGPTKVMYQKSIELLILKLPFKRLVHEIAQDFKFMGLCCKWCLDMTGWQVVS